MYKYMKSYKCYCDKCREVGYTIPHKNRALWRGISQHILDTDPKYGNWDTDEGELILRHHKSKKDKQ